MPKEKVLNKIGEQNEIESKEKKTYTQVLQLFFPLTLQFWAGFGHP